MFGSFELVCNRANMALCPLVGPYEDPNVFGNGVLVRCYSRSVMIANTMIFNIGEVFIHLGALVLIAISIRNIYKKYTAVGRREMLDLCYLFFAFEVWSLIVQAGVSPPISGSYPYFVAILYGLASAFCMLLLCTSLIGYQFWEDGSFKSVWGLRTTSFLWGFTVFIICIFTFQGGKSGWPSTLNPQNTTPLMVVLFVINAVFLFLYACLSFYLCGVLLKDWWAFCTYVSALLVFVAGQLLMYAFGYLICNAVRHYIDGIFFNTVCNVFAFLMIYRAYDSLTTEDLEFTVSLHDNLDPEKDDDMSFHESTLNLVRPY